MKDRKVWLSWLLLAGAALTALTRSPNRQIQEIAETDEEFQLRVEAGMAYRNHLLEALKSTNEKSDNLILTLSSALLGVSLAFIKDIVPIEQVAALWGLTFSWVMFGLAIACVFVSHFTAERAIESEYERNDVVNIQGDEKERRRTWDIRTRRLNQTAAICFLLAVFSTISVVSINLWQENVKMSEKKITTIVPRDPKSEAGVVMPQRAPAVPTRKPTPPSPPKPPNPKK